MAICTNQPGTGFYYLITVISDEPMKTSQVGVYRPGHLAVLKGEGNSLKVWRVGGGGSQGSIPQHLKYRVCNQVQVFTTCSQVS